MHHNRIFIVFGILVALSPFVGLPYSWLAVLLPVLGALIVLCALLFGRARQAPPVVVTDSAIYETSSGV